ncbi:TPA: hypothetical protein N0F65_001072 [Lagenidium giganteum]|uniref:Uncharacterized protein n=1 Tax=Lagenidium giganteum TaxID=4803 RepID=A0AAV2YGP1_9STRA|nr:TPA: hypothetical protein N0F65_001072 [Lagenidium giganteum]
MIAREAIIRRVRQSQVQGHKRGSLWSHHKCERLNRAKCAEDMVRPEVTRGLRNGNQRIHHDPAEGSVMNNHVPDIPLFFEDNLHIDMQDVNVEQRVLHYFKTARQLTERSRFTAIFSDLEEERECCQILMQSLEPRALRDEVERVVWYQQKHDRRDERALFTLVFERALKQEKSLRRRRESRAKPQTVKDSNQGQKRAT